MTDSRSSGRVSIQYQLIRWGSRTFRRMRQKPLFQKVPLSTKWLAVIFLVIIPSIYLVFFLFKQTHTNYYLFTGPQGGTHYKLGSRLAAILNQPDKLEKFLHLNIVPDFIPRESCGSLDNIFYINQGLAQLGLAEDGLPLYFEEPPKCSLELNQKELKGKVHSAEIRLRALMPLYRSPLHIVARKDLGISDVRDIPPHTKVYMGPEGGATALVANLILNHYGIPIERQGINLHSREALQQMIDGNITVGFFLMGLNADAMQRISQYPQFKLLTVERAESMKFLYPYLEVITIPGTIYKNSPRDIVTLGTKTLLVTSTDLGDHEVYEIADKLSHSIHDIIKDIPYNATKVTDSDPQKEIYYPLHEGAIRFYKHNPPFFLDPRALAGIGSYLTVLFALYKVSAQFIRNYRVHRILHAVERAVLAFHIVSAQPRWKRYGFYTHKLKLKALAMLRHQRITMDDFERIDEYINGQLPMTW